MERRDESRTHYGGSSKTGNYFQFKMDLDDGRASGSKSTERKEKVPVRTYAAKDSVSTRKTREAVPVKRNVSATKQHEAAAVKRRGAATVKRRGAAPVKRSASSARRQDTSSVRKYNAGSAKRRHEITAQIQSVDWNRYASQVWKKVKQTGAGLANNQHMSRILLLPVCFLYFEVMLRIFNKTGVFQHLIYPLLFGLAAGLFCTVISSLLSEKINRLITTIILFVTGIMFIIECLIKDSYQVYMTLHAIMSGASGVVGGYSSSLLSAIFHGVPMIVFFMLPGVLYRLFISKKIRPVSCQWKRNAATLATALAIFVIGILVASHGNTKLKYTTQYDFNTATQNFGLITSIRLDAIHGLFGSQRGDFVSDAYEETADETEAETEVVEYGRNQSDIDFAGRAETDSNDTVKAIDKYVASQTASSQNAYTGLFKGKNIIVIAAEAFSDAVVSEALTPTIYRLMHNGFYFSDFYQPSWGGSTSTGEYSILTGLVPLNGVDTMLETQNLNNYYTIGSQFQRIGYKSYAFHDGDYDFYDRNMTHENLGYDKFIAIGSGLEDIAGAWTGDEAMFDKTLDYYMDQQPFSVYYMTISGHCTYDADSEYVEKHGDYVRSVVGNKYKDTTFYYLCYQYELECALKTMVEKLEAAGIADDTVICMTADHYPYGLENTATFNNTEDYVSDLYGYTYTTPWECDHNALIIWSGSLEHEDQAMACEISVPTSSLDILPTIANLFGLSFDSRLIVGRDVFSDEEPLVLWNDYSWKTDQGTYNAATDVFTPAPGVTVGGDYVQATSNKVNNKILFSDHVHKTNYYNILFGNN